MGIGDQGDSSGVITVPWESQVHGRGEDEFSLASLPCDRQLCSLDKQSLKTIGSL